METIYKTFRTIVKSVDEKEGLIDMLIPMSTSSEDRDNDILEPLMFKKSLPLFKKRPVLVSSHTYNDLRKQIGEFASIKINEEGLFAKPKYYINEGNNEADWAFKLASRGMAAFSVGFIPKKWEDGDGEKTPLKRYTEGELLEISQVIIPSNRDAIQSIRSKSIDPIIQEICDKVEKELPKVLEEISSGTINEELEESEKELNLKPYPQEHSCRLRSPDDFKPDSFRRTEREHEGKKYSIIMGRLKGETTMTEQAYRYDKDVWEASEARKHCKEHDGSFEAAKPERTSQEQIIDEIDYLDTLILKEGLSDEAKEQSKILLFTLLKNLNYEGWKHFEMVDDKIVENGMDIRRLPGDDTPVEKKDIDKEEEKTRKLEEKEKPQKLAIEEMHEVILTIKSRRK